MDEEKQFQATKNAFLSAYVDKMKKAGVCFKIGDSTCKSQEMYWNLFKLNMVSLVSAMAAAGERGLSLSGVLSGTFSEVGKDPNRRYIRPKFKISSKIGDIYKNNPSLFKETVNSPEEFLEFFQENFAALGGDALLETYDRATAEPTAEVDEVISNSTNFHT